MKIGYFGDGPWSHAALEKIIQDDTLEVGFVVPRTDTKDMTLKEMSKRIGSPYLPGSKVSSSDFYEVAKAINCDLFVSMSFNQIFRNRLINLPPEKTINCHAGKLPFYRGRNVLNWVLINDETEFGITVHYVDEGIDTGDILTQQTFPITDEDDYSTVLEVAYTGCAEILYDTIKTIQRSEQNPIKQVTMHPVGHYCGVRTFGDELINWHQESRDIFNFIRSICDPGPMARTFAGEFEVKINRSKLIDQAPIYKSIVGQIVGSNDDGLVIKTGSSTLLITEYTCDRKLRVGDRLSGPLTKTE